MGKVIWEEKSSRCTIQIVSTPNWKGGIPINPLIHKWLVKIIDRHTQDEYCPTDNELINYIPNTYDLYSLELIAKAFKIKEKHNRKNLRNPEIRFKEKQFNAIINAIKKKRNGRNTYKNQKILKTLSTYWKE